MSLREEQKQHSRQALLNTVLTLHFEGHPFHSLSLREVTRLAGFVPAAFYRHFKDMDDLSLQLIDEAALRIKTTLHHFLSSIPLSPTTDIAPFQEALTIFFDRLESYATYWNFFISSRWGSTLLLQQTVHHEIEFLIQDLANHSFFDSNDTQRFTLSDLFINTTLNWGMCWIQLNTVPELSDLDLESQRTKFKQQCLDQFIFLHRSTFDRSHAV